MALHSYSALNSEGKTVRGRIDAESISAARQQLRDLQLNPLSVQPVVDRQRPGKWPGGQQRKILSSSRLALLLRQLATMLKSGQPLADALFAISEQCPPQQRELLRTLRRGLQEGTPFSATLRGFSREFPPLYVSSIAAAEKSGSLTSVLEELADHAEQQHTLKQNLWLALSYPILLALVATAIIIALLIYVMPQVVQVFDALDTELPPITRFMLLTSDLVAGFGWIAVVLVFFAGITLAIMRRSPPQRLRLDSAAIRLPVIGALIADQQIARFTRTLGVACKNAVPVPEAMEMAAATTTNSALFAAIEEARQNVVEGVSLYHALSACGYFPPVLMQLIHSGEHGGNLGELLTHAAKLLHDDYSNRLKVQVNLIEPALILIMGSVVLLIVLAILVPILDLNTLVQ